jgi:hypothetical protein
MRPGKGIRRNPLKHDPTMPSTAQSFDLNPLKNDPIGPTGFQYEPVPTMMDEG